MLFRSEIKKGYVVFFGVKRTDTDEDYNYILRKIKNLRIFHDQDGKINKSLNDVQQTNHTLLDTKRSISLNDRFLFQRELFDNDRLAMNNMMLKLQSFNTYQECENYLSNNTDWDFNDDIVAKFLEMLKEGF